MPVGTRREIAESIQHSPNMEMLAIGNGKVLLVECGGARRKVEGQLKQLAHMEEMVVSDPEIMRGTPVFKGTRIPVDLVADMLAQGATAEEILEGYPTLNKEKIAIAPLYMRAFPRRGRPSRRPWQWKRVRGRKSVSTELSPQECMRFLIDECLRRIHVRHEQSCRFHSALQRNGTSRGPHHHRSECSAPRGSAPCSRRPFCTWEGKS